MTGATVTRARLSDKIHNEMGMPRQQCMNLVENVLDEMVGAIIKEGNLKIASFGSFSVRKKGERIGRNPRTKVEAVITPRKVLSFKASHLLKNRVNRTSKKK